ncbi:hypothetical protein F5148DRAFT_1150079 [Russula earlei]|uniref:Uncharacterized protein n=1 Tax=Russula earlei TaxID=71964 RepID=A0ACC0U641_9AGAM|nr:hypothetical protein F5148DRAFT_1150079 [Russula earlei]
MTANKTITSHQCISSAVTLVSQPSLARGQGANNTPRAVPPHLLQARIRRALIAVHWGVGIGMPRSSGSVPGMRSDRCGHCGHPSPTASSSSSSLSVFIVFTTATGVVVHDTQDSAVEEDVQLGEGMHPRTPCAG